MNSRVDIIIPAFRAHNTIVRTLDSVINQSIKQDIDVLIVNDCCPEGDYQNIVNLYKDKISIREIKTNTNLGPGLARQFGMDSTNNPFIAFIDADDTYMNVYSLQTLRDEIIKDENMVTVYAPFVKNEAGTLELITENMPIWVFGKIYRRDFLESNNIKFPNTRANEDTCFNIKIGLVCAQSGTYTQRLESPLYSWNQSATSITRRNDGRYIGDQSICGLIDGLIDIYDYAVAHEIDKDIINTEMMDRFVYLYLYFTFIMANYSLFEEQAWEYIKKIYNHCLRDIYRIYHTTDFNNLFVKVLSEEYSYGICSGRAFIPSITFFEFVKRLNKHKYNVKDIYKIWKKLPKNIIEDNEECGAVPKGYIDKEK